MKQGNFPRMHVSLYVTDINATIKFYTDFFEKEPVKVKADYAKFVLDSPSLIISFVQNPNRVNRNFGHLGFQVATKELMEEKLTAMKALHYKVLEEMGTSCCYAVQDKFWINDPDGVQWEVYYFHEDAEFNDPQYASEDASACCMPPAQEAKKKVSLKELTVTQSAEVCEPGSGCC